MKIFDAQNTNISDFTQIEKASMVCFLNFVLRNLSQINLRQWRILSGLKMKSYFPPPSKELSSGDVITPSILT